jgi:hypothetical protein
MMCSCAWDILKRQRDKRWRSDRGQVQHRPEGTITCRISESKALLFPGQGWILASVLGWLISTGNYVFLDGGPPSDVRQFFRIRNVTGQVKRLQPRLVFPVAVRVFAFWQCPKAHRILLRGRHCTDPITCEFYDRCNSAASPDDHIGYLPRLQASAMPRNWRRWASSPSHDIPDDFPLK